MKSFVVVVCSLACAYAAVVSDPIATVVKSAYELSPQGDFQYGFETDNGIFQEASGKVKTVGKDEVALEVVGSSKYVDSNGEKVELSYIANEFGYQPQGSHLPTPPAPLPLPEYVARAIKYIEDHPPKEEYNAKKF